MSDDRDKRRFADPLHPPEYGGVSGVCDSGDGIGREDPTPVGAVSRRKRIEPVEVDPSAFEPDPRWADFDEMQAEFRICREDRLKRERWKKWIWGSGIFSGAGIIALLAWIGTSLEARATAAVEQKHRVEMLKEHETLLRDLSSWRRVVDYALGLRVPGGPNP